MGSSPKYDEGEGSFVLSKWISYFLCGTWWQSWEEEGEDLPHTVILRCATIYTETMSANFIASPLPGPPAPDRIYSASQHLARQQYPAQQQRSATQLTWQRIDLDAIGVPAVCNLPASVVENMKQQWEGKPIQIHTGLQNCIQSEPYYRELAEWKDYLLQVRSDLLKSDLEAVNTL